MPATSAASSIDPAEVARFDAMAKTWWDPKGPMAVLHRFNPLRLAFVRDVACAHFGRDAKTPRVLDGLSLVDIGCGGGVLSEPLARLGATVSDRVTPAKVWWKVARTSSRNGQTTWLASAMSMCPAISSGDSSMRPGRPETMSKSDTHSP